MSTEQKDTITVELPIRADGDWVYVAGLSTKRDRWRKIASGDLRDVSKIMANIAPAVVAWIERDEWEPLDVPEVGRIIRATLRDGSEVEGKVRQVNDMGMYADVRMGDDVFAIDTSPNAHPDPADIIAWEYVDEPEPATATVTIDVRANIAGLADDLQAAVDAIRAATK